MEARMRLRIFVAVAALGASGCAPSDGIENASPAAPRASVRIVNRASTTITGQPLAGPPQPWETVISVSDLPLGGVLPMHRHPWPRYAYVERGRLSVTYEAAGITREFGPGEAVVEAIDQWHEGRVLGSEPVRLIVFDQLPPGASNVVLR
jgi:quercetin dioxygenase-like cupin family protein